MAHAKIDPSIEAARLYNHICVSSFAQLDKMKEKIAALGMAKKLAPEDAAKYLSSNVSSAQKDNMWVLRSPETQQLLSIMYDTSGICVVTVHQANEAVLFKEFNIAIEALAKGIGGTRKDYPLVKREDGENRYSAVSNRNDTFLFGFRKMPLTRDGIQSYTLGFGPL